MRKLFIFIGLFLTLSLSGQMAGIVASNGGIAAEEECDQNLLIYSEQLGNGAYWNNGNASVTATNSANDINGEATMETLAVTWSNAAYAQNATVISGTTYRFSFEVKRGTATELMYSIVDGTHYSDIIAATSYYSSTNASTTVRISVEFTTPAGCLIAECYILRGSSENGTVYVGRVQLETNGSCYITTTSSIITP